ncbi:polysaccharide deacetylase family protein [Actinokineospora sp. HUAS TT18]|uniref:polysaccharide deacetylase family protein n=1 Tax=Actinokineospora sp. HUAS TT18 TaxID=3447451 RepID=UPI003F524FD5
MADWTNRRRTTAIAGAAAAVLVAAVVAVVAVRSGDEDPPAAGPTTTTTTTTSPATSSTPTTSTAGGTTSPSPAPSTSATRPTTTAATTTSRATTRPAPPFPESLRGQDVTAIPTSRAVVALTFDAGSNSAGLPSILATLAAKRVPATFFLTGSFAAANPAGVKAIAGGGHRVGNHSMNHLDFTTLSDVQLRDQVSRAQQALRDTGVDPRPLFRFPLGARDARTIRGVNDLGYVAVRWTVDTLGWKGTRGGITAEQVVDRTVGALRPGEIVLMHVGSNPDDGTTLDADALPRMIDRIRAAGYDFVTLDALLR